jgi:Kef-type K+ transport system membrane component KefB
MHGFTSILFDLFIMFAAAKVAGEVFNRFGHPAVIGELLAGMLIGPYTLGLVGHPVPDLVTQFHGEAEAKMALDSIYELLSGLGVVVLLFFVGLESPLSDLLRVGVRATGIALAGVVASFGLGLLLAAWLGLPGLSGLFVAATLVSTSVGISARVLADLGQLSSAAARLILSAAIIDDMLGLLVIGIVSAFGRDGGIDAPSVAALTAQALAFIGLGALVCTFAVRRLGWRIAGLHFRDAPFVVGMTLCLGLAALAGRVGLAALIGAFLAGVAFAETREQFELERRALPVYELLVPFFFVVTGMQVDWRLLLDPAVVPVAVAAVTVAILGKLAACGAAAWGLGRWTMAIVGLGMVPRGEVSLIAATVGASVGAITPTFFSVVVLVTVATALLVPPLMAVFYRGHARATEQGRWKVAQGVLPEF